ncbi:MAG: mechanosensitive ion channel family protein [Candidatus Diapherotrites archaeon]|nr:mechanosensitive ion channel family protein [Candidatus Diapherotrites archaeon]
MVRKYLKLLVYAAFLASLAYYMITPISHSAIDKAFISAGLILLTDAVLSFVSAFIKQAVKDRRDQYELRSIASYALYLTALVAVLFVWIEDPQTFVLGFGIMGAGFVIVFQDALLSIAAFAYIILVKPFSVGDRVEIGNNRGDVIDIDVFSTKLMEIGEWVKADQVTGRLVIIPNNVVFKSPITNYTKDFNFIWDEVYVPVTYGSDWKKATKILLDAAKNASEKMSRLAAHEIKELSSKYFLKEKDLDPHVYAELTDNWIGLSLRYVVPAAERRQVHNRVSTEVLERIGKARRIRIASESMSVELTKGSR